MRPLQLTRETVVESHLVKECTKLRVLCVKNKGTRGMPDRMCIWFDGIIDFVELKKPKGSTYEPLQLRTHAKLRARGSEVFVLYTKTQVDEYIALRQAHGRAIGEKISATGKTSREDD